MATYEWKRDPWRLEGRPGSALNPSGWYEIGTTNLIQSSYINPATGKAWTSAELSGGGGVATPTTTTTTPSYKPMPGHPGFGKTPEEQALAHEAYIAGGWGEGAGGAVTPPTPPVTPTVPTPTFGAGAAAAIPTPEVTPAPPYEPSPELQAWQKEYGEKLTDWVKAEGYGIPKETQALMIQQQTDTLKAREQENIRIMRNNMERRGITNSGYIDANMHMITSNTSVAIAGAIADVQIKSALMKMASFEKAMGAAAQFLGFLSEQSQLAYKPEFATWQTEQLAKMQVWQGKLDIYKMELNQAYQTQNMTYAAQIAAEVAEQQHMWDIEMAEIEIAASQEMAAAEAGGSISGSIVTGIFSVAAAVL